jgi:hypothetical protein
MKAVIITLALAGLASTAPVEAQILGTRLPTPATNTNAGINGSWQVVGRDGSGNTIYERRTQDRNGNIVVQRARRDSYGNMSIISTNTVGNTGVIGSVDGSWRVVGRDGNGNTIYERRTTDRNGNIIVQRARRDSYGNMSIISTNTIGNNSNRGNNCAYNQSTNSVGDIIFGRTNTNVNCDDVGNRVDGGWYQVGQGRDNNSIYERRVRDANGNLVIQRARRNSNGTFTILSSRGYNDNSDKQWRKAQRKQQKEQNKQYKKSRGENGDNGDNGDNRQGVVSGDDRSYVAGNAEAKGNGHGKGNGNGKGKHKGND